MAEVKEIKLVEPQSILSLPVQEKRCSDYDEDCLPFTPEEAWNCWIGSCVFIEKIGQWVYTEQADGYCPIIHHAA